MLSILASTLGGTFLTGLIAIWIKDNEILKLSSDLAIGAMQKKTSDYLEKRKITRLLHQIEDDILETISVHLEGEYRHIRKGDKVLIVKQVIELIGSEEFYNACYEEAFNQTRLLDRFKETILTSTTALSIHEPSAALNISGFIIAKYLAILSSLPSFTIDTLRTLLKDTDEILERIKGIEIELSTLNVKITDDFDEDEKNFRRMVSKKLRHIDVFGIDSRILAKRYDLSIAYVNLTLSAEVEDHEASSFSVLQTAFLGDNPLITIKGDPGSGKTTLLSWLALNCAEKSLKNGLDSIDEMLPVFIRIREYADKKLPSGIDLLTAQFGVACDSFTDGWLKEKMGKGKLIVFVDGFDEVSLEKRTEVTEWVQNLLIYFENLKVVISTRPYADNELNELVDTFGDPEAEILVEPMNTKQVNKFIDNWYAAYSRGTDLLEQKNRLEIAKDRLVERLEGNASLRALIRNPLICSLICFVTADRDGFVPDQRGDLYLLATETLLDRRDRERGIVDTQGITLTKQQKFKILGFIAEYFGKRRSAQLETETVVSCLREYLPSLNLPAEASNNIVHYLSERSHILRCPSHGYIDFAHKTFLEYFYARRLTDLSMLEEVLESFFEEDYREIVHFVFAVAPPPFVNKLISEVVDNIEELRSAHKDTRSEVLILQTAIQQATEIDLNIRNKALALLSEVLPPKNRHEAEQLSYVGEVILEPLKAYTYKKYTKYWEFIIYAALHTFSDDAAYTLVNFARMGDKKVDQQLLAGRRYFDGDTYRNVVISQCRTITKLVVNDWIDLELASSLPLVSSVVIKNYSDSWEDASLSENLSIKRLEIVDTNQVEDLSILKYFPNLIALTIISCTGVDDYTELKKLKSLKELTIYSEVISTLNFLDKMRTLETLDLSECMNLSNISALNSLTRLETLQLPYSYMYDELNAVFSEEKRDIDLDFIEVNDVFDDNFMDISLADGYDGEKF